MSRARAAAALTPLLLTACGGLATNLSGGGGAEAGLLRGKTPARSSGVTHLDRLGDGIAGEPGDPWRTDLTAVFASPEAFVLYDLGGATPLRCAAIQADGDDRYTLSVSSDGETFAPVFEAAPADDAGLQLRLARQLPAGTSARYLRLQAAGGDGRYAVAEVGVWSDCPARFPPPLAMQKGTPVGEAVRLKVWAFAGLAAAFLLAYRRRAPDFVKLLIAAPVGVALALAVQLAELWPLEAQIWGQLAAAIGVVVVAALVRVAVGRAWRARRARADAAKTTAPRP